LSVWPSSVRIVWPVSRSQSRSVRSHEADTARRPSGVTATALTMFVWPSRVRSVWPVSKSQSIRVRSYEPDNARCPSGVTATAQTLSGPSKVRNVWPVSKSQRRSVRSSEAEIACRPSGGRIATALTELVWPWSVRIRKWPAGVELLFGGRRPARFSMASFGTGSAPGCWTPAPTKLIGTASFPLWLTVELAGPIQPVDPPPVATPTWSLNCCGPPGSPFESDTLGLSFP
jgi:hypothetical protein